MADLTITASQVKAGAGAVDSDFDHGQKLDEVAGCAAGAERCSPVPTSLSDYDHWQRVQRMGNSDYSAFERSAG